MPCDCGATCEERQAGIHRDACCSHDGQSDEPSDHYGQ